MSRSVILLALFGALYVIQTRIDATFGDYRATEEILYVEDGKLLGKLSLGFESVLADLYWLRTVQYFGGKRLEEENKNYALLKPLLDITTDLDPNFKIAFTYGATFLSEPFPRGAGAPEEGIALIDRGIEHHPDYWRFYLDKGFLYFWFMDDCEKAAETFLEGSKIEGAPYWMVATASRTLTGCGEREMSRTLWALLHETAETPQQRENAAVHLQQLDALDQMDALRDVLERYETATGRAPASWQELIAAGYLKSLPFDPTGAPYVLQTSPLDVTLSEDTELGVLPRGR